MHRERDSERHRSPSLMGFVVQTLSARLNFLAYRVQDLATPIPIAARKVFGLPLLTWTVRTPEERAHAARFADQMIFEGFRP
jgi:glycerophosphoryl diester phosphodiesterase